MQNLSKQGTVCWSICFQVGLPFVSKETNKKSVTAPQDNTNKTDGSAGLSCYYCLEHYHHYHHHRRRHCTFETLGFLTLWVCNINCSKVLMLLRFPCSNKMCRTPLRRQEHSVSNVCLKNLQLTSLV